MRNLKIFLCSFFTLLIFYAIMGVIFNFIIYGEFRAIELHRFLPVLPTTVILALGQLLWGNYVKRIYKYSEFDESNWEKTLMRFSVTEISISDSKKIYKMPFMKNLFPAEIVVDYTDENIIIKAPLRVMHYYKNG